MKDSSNNGKSRVLRAKDILPPFDKVIDHEQDRNERTIPPNEGIPKFDLAEQILAEQRKVAATKRKRPANSSLVPRPSSLDTCSSDYPPNLQHKELLQEQIIAEIVAKDIKKLCGSSKTPK